MEYFVLRKVDLGEIILSVLAGIDYIYVGGSNKTLRKVAINNSFIEIKCTHSKSIRHITSYNNMIGCGSYDCKATIFKDEIIIDILEGPDTEIKGIAICNEYVALATRGRSVWVYKIEDNIEIDTILEDHTQDIKGVKWNMGCLYSYGYDGTINIYENMELIQSIKEHRSTVWDIQFYGTNSMVSCGEDGEIIIYSYDNIWLVRNKLIGSNFPIYSMAIYKDNIIAYVHNRSSILFMDNIGNIILIIKNIIVGDIYSISIFGNILVIGGEDGMLNIIKLE